MIVLDPVIFADFADDKTVDRIVTGTVDLLAYGTPIIWQVRGLEWLPTGVARQEDGWFEVVGSCIVDQRFPSFVAAESRVREQWTDYLPDLLKGKH